VVACRKGLRNGCDGIGRNNDMMEACKNRSREDGRKGGREDVCV